MITYAMCVFNAIHCTMAVELTQQSKNLIFLPTFHTAGLNVYANPIFHIGGTNVVMRVFDPDEFCALLSDKSIFITHALGVPTNFLMLVQTPGFADADFSNLVCLGIGGGGCAAGADRKVRRQGRDAAAALGHDGDGAARFAAEYRQGPLEKVGSSGLAAALYRTADCRR